MSPLARGPRGAALKAAEQPIDTSTAAGKCFLDMLGVFAEFETNLRRERLLEGDCQGEGRRRLQGPAGHDRGLTGARTEGAGHEADGYRQGAQDRSRVVLTRRPAAPRAAGHDRGRAGARIEGWRHEAPQHIRTVYPACAL
jgi:Resolvase, N terminal domain